MERNLWHASYVGFFRVSNRRIRFNIWRAGRRPAFF